jgi:hypothetical protein
MEAVLSSGGIIIFCGPAKLRWRRGLVKVLQRVESIRDGLYAMGRPDGGSDDFFDQPRPGANGCAGGNDRSVQRWLVLLRAADKEPMRSARRYKAMVRPRGAKAGARSRSACSDLCNFAGHDVGRDGRPNACKETKITARPCSSSGRHDRQGLLLRGHYRVCQQREWPTHERSRRQSCRQSRL